MLFHMELSCKTLPTLCVLFSYLDCFLNSSVHFNGKIWQSLEFYEVEGSEMFCCIKTFFTPEKPFLESAICQEI